MFKAFKKFLSGLKRLRHYDPNFKVASLSVVSLTEVCHFYWQTVENMFADDKWFVHFIQNCVARQQHVYLLQEVQTRYSLKFVDSLYGDLSLQTLNNLGIIAIETTLFQQLNSL